MKRSLLLLSPIIGGLSIIAMPATADHSHSSKTAPALYGRLEGTVLTPDGVPVWEAGNKGGIHVMGVSEDGRTKFDVASNTLMGGLYRVDNLPAGYYDVGIREGFVNGISFCPQEIYAVQIKPGERTELNVMMDQGNTLTITGKPVYETPSAARAAEQAEADAAAASAEKAKADAAAEKKATDEKAKADPASSGSAVASTDSEGMKPAAK